DSPGHEPRTRNPDLGLGSARDDGPVGVSDYDVANAQCRAAIGVTLDLRAANFDLVPIAEILFYRGGEPRSDDIELDLSAAEPQPQSHKGNHHDARRGAEGIGHLAQATPPLDEASAQRRARTALHRLPLG